MKKNYALLAATSAVLVVGVTALSLSSPVRAQESAQAATLPSPSAIPTATTTTTTTTTGAAPAATSTSGTVFVPAASAALGASPSATVPLGTAGNAKLLEPTQTPAVVTDAVNGLQKTDPINLDDMIRAQDAINRLDLLLEIEKRQSEIKKIRDERNKPSMGGLGGAIPASALNLPSMGIKPIRSSSSGNDDDMGSSSSSSGGIDKYALKRIIGANGRYAAVLSGSDDKLQTVHAGDKLSDGTQVKSVNLTSVSLSKGKKSRSLTIPSDSYISRE